MLIERVHSKQKGMPIFWCTASLGTFPASASHSLIFPGTAHLPLTPKSCVTQALPAALLLSASLRRDM